jgi:hypothetical protein
MRIDGVTAALRSRVRHPGRLGLLLLVPAAWGVVRLAIDSPFGRFGQAEAFIPFLLTFLGLLLAPLPWQWTGEDAPLAGLGRGLLQSLLWNGLWLGLLILALNSLVAPQPHHPPPPPRPEFGGPPPPPHREGPPRPAPPPNPELQLLSLGLLLGTVLGRILAEREAVEVREAALQTKADAARALALQAQMQPHALFNSLSGLVELVREDPQATEEALVALCDYLRRLMAHGRATTATLCAERELLEDYLRIEQIRLGDRLNIHWAWPVWADELQLPPLLLQPLVENAILHGIAPNPEGGKLRLAVTRDETALRLEIANTGRAATGDRNGTGLGHLQERLALWNPAATFDLDREGLWTRATIRIPAC